MSESSSKPVQRSVLKRQRNVAAPEQRRYTSVQRNARISPRKARSAMALIRGKRAEEALNILAFDTTRASDLVRKVLQAAIADAASVGGHDPMLLRVVHAAVDEGIRIKRFHVRGRGRAAGIVKANSHLVVSVAAASE